MSDITLTAAQVSAIYPDLAEIYQHDAGVTITRGQALYKTSAGLLGVADANDSGKQQFRGLALNGGGAGQGIDLLKKGHVYGFDLSGLNIDAPVYLSDTAGAFGTAAGTMSVQVGRVDAINVSGTKTKVLYIEADWLRTWS